MKAILNAAAIAAVTASAAAQAQPNAADRLYNGAGEYKVAVIGYIDTVASFCGYAMTDDIHKSVSSMKEIIFQYGGSVFTDYQLGMQVALSDIGEEAVEAERPDYSMSDACTYLAGGIIVMMMNGKDVFDTKLDENKFK